MANESAGTNVFFDDFTVKQLGVDITQTTDYYPGGSVSNHWEKEPYRFGYQGEYSEEDEETGFNTFEARKYDARINRWLSVDPMRQYYSGYVGMGNNWMNKVDPDGRCDECPKDPSVTMWVNPTDRNFTTYVRDSGGEWVRETGMLDGEIFVTARSGGGQFIPKLPFFFYTPPDPTTYVVFDPVTNIITIGNGQMEGDYWLGKHNGGRSNMVETAMFDMLALTGQKSAGRFQKPGGPPGRTGYIGNLMDQYKDAMKPKLTPDTVIFYNGHGYTLIYKHAVDTAFNTHDGTKTPRSSSGPTNGNFSPSDRLPWSGN